MPKDTLDALKDTVEDEISEFKKIVENKTINYAEDIEYMIEIMEDMVSKEKLLVWSEDLYKEAQTYLIKLFKDDELL